MPSAPSTTIASTITTNVAGLGRGQRDVVERERQIGRRLEASVGPLLEAAHDDSRERAGNAGRNRRRLILEDRVRFLDAGLGGERPAPREHLEHDDAEREDVGARVDRAARELLGRHVARRPDDDAGAGRRGRQRRRVRDVARRVAAELRDPEVEDLDAPAVGHEHVVGLDVAVDHARAVRGGEPVGQLGRDPHDVAQRDRRLGDPRAQRLAVE